MDIEVKAPKTQVDAYVKLRLRVMALVIFELGEVCGVDLGGDLEKGLIQKDVLESILIRFEGIDNRGKNVFMPV